MKKILFILLIINAFAVMKAQKDSIFISADLLDERQILVKQKIVYYNPLEKPISKIKLLNWLVAYRSKKTPLAKRKLEDGDTQMHFAKKNQLGQVSDLKIKLGEVEFSNLDIEQENIYLPLLVPLNKGENVELDLEYRLQIPDAKFTFYGQNEKNVHLKYFFLVPDAFEDENQSPRFFLDLEETQNTKSFWEVKFNIPDGYFLQSNLERIGNQNIFRGESPTDVEFHLSKKKNKSFFIDINTSKIEVELAYSIDNKELEFLEFYLPLQFKFIQERIGWLPEKLFISLKQRKKMSFLGNDDIQLWKQRFPLFTEAEKLDLDYFSLISQNILDRAFLVDKNELHWLEDGLKTYLEIQYLKKFYAQHLLVGNIKNWTFLGLKPFKWLNVSKLNLIDRYGIAYQYVMGQNTDQAIGSRLEELTNVNHTVNAFGMGILLDFLSEKEGKIKFEDFLKNYFKNNQGKSIEKFHFVDKLELYFGGNQYFIRDFLEKKQRVDFSLEELKKVSENTYKIKVAKNTLKSIPFKLEVKNGQDESEYFWLDTLENQEETEYLLSVHQPKKLIVNPNYGFLESNFRNNFSERRWFGFAKKLKFKLFTDIPNPEYNEVYLNPDVRYNIYDELLLGLDFSNYSLMPPAFTYYFRPFMSVGERKITGTGKITYKIQPINAFFRQLSIGLSGDYFHYDYNLSYRKFSLFSNLEWSKNPRSLVSKNLSLTYQYIDRDLSPFANIERNYAYYGLWTFGFHIRDEHPIHEKYITTKFRWYGGLFLKNQAKNNSFNFGISKINDYNFTYSLLGQSATSGLYSQEFILAEGGFKSYVGSSANQWILALNTDVPIWKIFGIYMDLGMYKNKGNLARFVWDSGVRLSLVPNVLEVYFPVQSALGFEPALERYDKRIRFSLNLEVDNLIRTAKKIIQ